MPAKKASTPKVVTPQILKMEIDRLDAKIDVSTQSMKDYTDSCFNALDTKLTKRFDKLEGYFEQLVGMIMQQNKKIDTALERLDNHACVPKRLFAM
jgi:hypothetical protein